LNIERIGRRSASVLELYSGLLLFKKTVDYSPDVITNLDNWISAYLLPSLRCV